MLYLKETYHRFKDLLQICGVTKYSGKLRLSKKLIAKWITIWSTRPCYTLAYGGSWIIYVVKLHQGEVAAWEGCAVSLWV
jgi:hypothetical protein